MARSCLERSTSKAVEGALTLRAGQREDSSPAAYEQEGLCKQKRSEQWKAGEPQGNQHCLITCLQ